MIIFIHTALQNLISEISNKNIMLMGDFNYPSIDWVTCSVQDTVSSEAQIFLHHLGDCPSLLSERVDNCWNMLDQDAISVKTLKGFKTKLEKE